MPERAILERLRAAVGTRNVLVDDAERAPYERDATGRYLGRAMAVVRPDSTEEVAAVLEVAHGAGLPVIPVGGNTGLSGGTFPGRDGRAIMLDLRRMNRIREIRPEARVAVVEAGVILDDLRAAAEAHDLVFPLVFGARGSCTIGGNLATNAGGSNVLRYGSARQLCLGVELVLADGTIVDLMNALVKDNTGYDLRDLVIGSEGTLAVITGAVLRLFPRPRAYATALVAIPSPGAGLRLLNRLQAASSGAVEACEYMPRSYFDTLCRVFPDTRLPLASPFEHAVLIEIGATAERDATPGPDGRLPVEALLESELAAAAEAGEVLDAALARSEAQRQQMWEMRERAYEVAVADGVPVVTDIAVPLDRVETFLERIPARLAPLLPGAKASVVSHLGDGNIHYAVTLPAGADGRPDEALAEKVMMAIEDLVEELGGSFSAEHGVGVSKLGSMARHKNPAALRMMRAIKTALDPKGILNPGKVLPQLGR